MSSSAVENDATLCLFSPRCPGSSERRRFKDAEGDCDGDCGRQSGSDLIATPDTYRWLALIAVAIAWNGGDAPLLEVSRGSASLTYHLPPRMPC
jgi:hypothetical protein